MTSCSHNPRLYTYSPLRLRWRLSVTLWGYTGIGCSDLSDVFQSLFEAAQAWVTFFSHCLRLYCRCAKLQRTWRMRVLIVWLHVFILLSPGWHSTPLCPGIAEWLLIYRKKNRVAPPLFGRWVQIRNGTNITLWIYNTIRELTGTYKTVTTPDIKRSQTYITWYKNMEVFRDTPGEIHICRVYIIWVQTVTASCIKWLRHMRYNVTTYKPSRLLPV